MSMHKGLIGKSVGGGSVGDKTLADYIRRKNQQEAFDNVSREKQYQWFIDRRIACPEAGYPSGEAMWGSVEEYVEFLEKALWP